MEEKQRLIISRLVIGSLLFFFLNRFFVHASLSGFGKPVITDVEMDIVYWFFQRSGIPFFIVRHPLAEQVFDVLLIGSGILSFLYPWKRFFLIPFALLLAVYAILFNLFAMHHYASTAILIIMLLPFCAGNTKNFSLAWEGMRYYLCLIFFIAFCWKFRLPHGSFYQFGHGMASFKANLADYMYHNPNTILTSLYAGCIRHSWILNLGDRLIFLLEGLMVIGLFTRKYDHILIFFPILIHLSTYFFADVFFFEFLIMDFAFLSSRQIDYIGNLVPAISRRNVFSDQA